MEENLDSSQSIKWDESEILGRGCQGTVVFAGHFNRHPVAVKRILLTNTQLVQRELEALIDCRGHPRILHLYHVEKDSQFLRLALELCAATLDEYCKGKYLGPVPEDLEALKQMLEGLSFLHSKKYVHRDVKPNNILITLSGDLKIADFGVCKPVKGVGSFSLSAAGVGTEGWIAPELLQNIMNVENGKLAASNATTAVDVFPLGCVFYYFLTKGTHPFGAQLYRNAYVLEGRYNLSKLTKKSSKNIILREIIKEMISAQPEQRPQLEEILRRPIFNTGFTTSDELLKDDTKFNIWLKDLKKRFSPSKKEHNVYQAKQIKNMRTDVHESVTAFHTPRNGDESFTSLTYDFSPMVNRTPVSLQVVNEEQNHVITTDEGFSGLRMSTTRPKAYSDAATRRSGVSSAPTSWQRTVPRRKIDRIFFLSEYYADGEDESDTTGSLHISQNRSATSLSNLEHGLNSSADNLSTLSQTSKSSKSGSTLSLSRTFIGDLFKKHL